jgi:hypothetical protein
MSVLRIKLPNFLRHRRLSSTARKRLALLVVLGASIVPAVGCSAWTGVNNTWKYNGYWNETMMGHRNKTSAHKAWHSRKHHFCNEKYLREFARGFRDGYIDVADGGSGCTPAFPPREYWGWKYQSCEGQARVAAWFSGFPHGARAAEEDGIGNWTQIQTSAAIQHQYSQNGMLSPNAAGLYPIPQAAVPNGSPYRDYVGPHGSSTEHFEVPTEGFSAPVGGETIGITNMPSVIQQ